MDFWTKSEPMEKIVKEERERLLGINDFDALKLSISDQYQRNKYKWEIEAAKMLEETRKTHVFEKPISKKYSKSHKHKSDNIINFKDRKNI